MRWQLRLIVLGTTFGAIVGSFALLSREGLRPAGLAAIVGIALLVPTLTPLRFARRTHFATAHSSRIGRVLLTVAAAAVVAVAFNALVVGTARGTPRANTADDARPSPATASPVVPAAPAAVPDAPAAPPALAARSVAPATSAIPVTPAPAGTTAPSQPPATSQSRAPSTPRPVVGTSSPTQTLAAPSPSPATAAPTSILPTLPPLPSISLPRVP
jgi:hypothetical protein